MRRRPTVLVPKMEVRKRGGFVLSNHDGRPSVVRRVHASHGRPGTPICIDFECPECRALCRTLRPSLWFDGWLTAPWHLLQEIEETL